MSTEPTDALIILIVSMVLIIYGIILTLMMSLHNNGINYYIAIVTILFHLPIEIECCSLTTDYIVNLIYDKENFLQDPCYIQWKATQDAKLAGPQKPTVEKALIEFDRLRVQEAIDDRLNRQKMYSSSSFTLPALAIKESAVPISLVFTLVVVLICCCTICVVICNEDDATDTATESPQRDVLSRESLNVLVQMTSEAANDPLIHEAMSTIAIAHSNFNNGIISSSRQYSRVNVPPMAGRQNSLPSYDEAVKMASAPPTE
ncbi:uncharacterized protein LOC119078636 [Bradysia coprophila]|uniref:uncharacterized protein LOC119078636 n=1 Tax=Bradysia coprophila TaxID=38358 RepID=UPI00187D6F23|nr:uncharacterized protein LOC119078636 [Bradysia coprophila]